MVYNSSNMLARLKVLWIILLLCSHVITEEEVEEKKDDLQQSESKDPGKVEIIKQIKRINADGSYTFGYEAEDGTFKIESRDVLGNVKGTFGFVDHDGEIKRVSYSSNNGSETSSLASDKDRSVVQSIPRTNKNNTTTRKPTIIFPQITPSPSSTVIQTIPRRRISSTQNTTSSTEKPLFKHIVKSTEYEVSSSRSQTTTEPTPRILTSHQQRTVYQNGHFIRSTVSPQVDVQRFTEGQLIRPTHPDTVTPRPNDNGYLRRLIVTRNPLYDDQINPTLKPITEQIDDGDSVRGNLLRRQLSQEKISDFDARQHLINLHQSTGSDAADVHGGQLTTGTPRPLFTTTSRPKLSSTVTTAKSIVSPIKYPVVYQKNAIRGPRLQDGYQPESTTDASNIAETNYVSPTPIPIIQIPHDENGIPLVRGRSLPRGAFLVPIHSVPNRYVYDEENHPQNHYQQQYTVPQNQYLREDIHQRYIQPTPIPRVTPLPFIIDRRRIPEDERDYRRQEMLDYIRPYPVPVHTNLQDDIDNIKPPVSTLDFQKLLNRLIIRQNHLREINRYEQSKMVNDYYPQDRYRHIPQPQPISIFVRTRDGRENNGPVQFLHPNQQRHNQRFIAIPQTQQHRMESQQQYHATDPYNPENYDPTPLYRQGRRAGRLIDPNMQQKDPNENYLPAEVREMLLLKMLQLAINPNLPIPPTDQELMTTANPPHRKEAVRNVQILGEEQDEEEKRNIRSKRYHDQNAELMDYYQ